jgi:hypothetical protein
MRAICIKDLESLERFKLYYCRPYTCTSQNCGEPAMSIHYDGGILNIHKDRFDKHLIVIDKDYEGNLY